MKVRSATLFICVLVLITGCMSETEQHSEPLATGPTPLYEYRVGLGYGFLGKVVQVTIDGYEVISIIGTDEIEQYAQLQGTKVLASGSSPKKDITVRVTVDDGQPYVIPTLYARDGDKLVLHGSVGGRLMKALSGGTRCCITVTLTDGLVLARSLLHHSVNYRSVVILGEGRELTGRELKTRALELLTDGIIPGRWNDARKPTEKELDATAVVEFPIEECSAKVRTGPPNGDEADYDLPHWAGVIPLELTAGTPIPDERLKPDTPLPPYVSTYPRPKLNC